MPEHNISTKDFLQAVFKTISDAVDEKQQQHPEDIMSTVSFVSETIYQFVANTPSGIWFK